MPGDCKHGQGCIKFGCRFQHPAGRRAECRHGSSCRRQDTCRFLHPAGRAVAGRPAGAGAGALVAAGSAGGRRNQAQRSEVVMKLSEQRRPMALQVAVDSSGSMNGDRLREACAGVKRIFKDVLAPQDFFGAVAFNQVVETLHQPMAKSRVDWAKDRANIYKTHSKPTAGGTALYDSILHSLAQMADYKAYLRRQEVGGAAAAAAAPVLQLVVVTDGADNASQARLGDVERALARHTLGRDFRFTLVAVGVSEHTQQTMERLCRAAPCCTFMLASDAAGLARHLDDIGSELRLLVTGNRGGGRASFRHEQVLDKKAGAQMVQALAGMAKLNLGGLMSGSAAGRMLAASSSSSGSSSSRSRSRGKRGGKSGPGR